MLASGNLVGGKNEGMRHAYWEKRRVSLRMSLVVGLEGSRQPCLLEAQRSD